MALEHALLVSLSERSGTGYQLTRRFDRSIGHWWRASHQQIYKTLARMTENGLVTYVEQAQDGKPDKKVYSITDTGRKTLSEWIRTPGKDATDRRELATKIRGAAPSDLPDLMVEVRRVRDLHAERADLFRSLEARDYPAPAATHRYGPAAAPRAARRRVLRAGHRRLARRSARRPHPLNQPFHQPGSISGLRISPCQPSTPTSSNPSTSVTRR